MKNVKIRPRSTLISLTALSFIIKIWSGIVSPTTENMYNSVFNDIIFPCQTNDAELSKPYGNVSWSFKVNYAKHFSLTIIFIVHNKPLWNNWAAEQNIQEKPAKMMKPINWRNGNIHFICSCRIKVILTL